MPTLPCVTWLAGVILDTRRFSIMGSCLWKTSCNPMYRCHRRKANMSPVSVRSQHVWHMCDLTVLTCEVRFFRQLAIGVNVKYSFYCGARHTVSSSCPSSMSTSPDGLEETGFPTTTPCVPGVPPSGPIYSAILVFVPSLLPHRIKLPLWQGMSMQRRQILHDLFNTEAL